MKLIASLTSPFARKVRVLLAEKNIPFELVVDIPWNADSSVPAYNPLGKIPVLIRADGTTLYDSRVIVDYLEQHTTEPRFIPEGGEAYIQVKRWEALADGISDAAATVFLERKREAAQQSPEWIARQLGKINLGLKTLALDLSDREFCVGNKLTLADIALACTLGYLDLRFPDIAWRLHYPNLAAFDQRLGLRSSLKNSQPPA